MGRPSWASPEEKTWLTSRKPEYTKAGSESRYHNFFSSTTEAFLSQWPKTPTDNMRKEAKDDADKINKLLKDFWEEVRTLSRVCIVC